MPRLELTEEEFIECLNEYVEVFKLSKKDATAEVHFRISMTSIGLDVFEIESLLKELR